MLTAALLDCRKTRADLNAFYRVGESGALAVHAHKLKRIVCPRGYIAGEWLGFAQTEGLRRQTLYNRLTGETKEAGILEQFCE